MAEGESVSIGYLHFGEDKKQNNDMFSFISCTDQLLQVNKMECSDGKASVLSFRVPIKELSSGMYMRSHIW